MVCLCLARGLSAERERPGASCRRGGALELVQVSCWKARRSRQRMLSVVKVCNDNPGLESILKL